MKYTVALTAACIASASAFAPSTTGARANTQLAAEKKEKQSFFSTVFGMDLFAPNADVNDYGARDKKKVST
jgi:hypothetical protein